MAVSQDEILETISNMSVMEVVDLISAMEEKFGVSAAAAVAAAPAAADAGAAAAEEKDEFDVVLTGIGENSELFFKFFHHQAGVSATETKVVGHGEIDINIILTCGDNRHISGGLIHGFNIGRSLNKVILHH